MHSSRMRTGRSLTVCWRLLPGVGGSGPGGVRSRGGGLVRGGLLWGVSAPRGVYGPRGVSAPGGLVVSQHALRQTPPPVDRITDACKNITLAQLRCGR